MYKFNYVFFVRPDKDRKINPALLLLLKPEDHRYERTFTEDEFRDFRDGLKVNGLELHEIERIGCEWEKVP